MTNALTHRRMIVFHGGQRSKVEGQREKNKQMKKVFWFQKAVFCVITSLILLIGCNTNKTTEIDLSGEWRFLMDPHDEGIAEKWYEGYLPETINLPGSMTSNNKGFDVGYDTEFIGNFWPMRHNPDYRWYKDTNYEPYLDDDAFLFPFWLISDKHYLGRAWYQKEIDIPDSWEGTNVELLLERCHWETQVWLNNMYLGTQNSLGIPHRYELTEMIEPGRHTISIAVDNRLKDIDVGSDSHSISDNTQTSWNGIIGDIKLIQTDRVSISHVNIFPDVENKQVLLEIEFKNIIGHSQQGNIRVQAKEIGSMSPHIIDPLTTDTEVKDGVSVISLSYPMGEEMLLWDEFQPNLYELTVDLTAGAYRDKVQERFGMRDFSISGTNFTINGRPIFLRGTLECAIFPKTGYPPTDVDSWERIIRICRDHGLNHLRFHSWCPPKAAFVAADNMGFYYQVEASSWTHVGDGNPIDQWLYEETELMLREYGNHPSFVMMSHGNEPHGPNRVEYLAKYLDHWKVRDARRLYTAGAGWPIIPESDYHNSASRARIQGWGQELNSIVNSQPPRTNFDWSAAVSSYDKPLVSHEIGQWCVYPNLDEIEKYDGVMKPTNFQIFKRSFEANHMLHLAGQFLMASGKLQAKLYKADIEAALRTRGQGGFQLLDLHDFPGQGTALVGVLDAFWEEKGYISPEKFRRFCNETVALARLDRRIFTENDTLIAHIEVAHFGETPLQGINPLWKLLHDNKIIAEGHLGQRNIPIGNGIELGTITYGFRKVSSPRKLVLQVDIADFANSWDIWVVPEEQTLYADDVRVVDQLDQASITYLEEGGKLLLSIGKGRVAPEMGGEVGVGFSSIFWNTAWTNKQKPHTLGILCDPDHPALKLFPTEYHSNWQWWDAMRHADAIKLDMFPPNYEPIVRIIDDWVTNRRLALLLEAKVEKGSILISGTDLINNLENRPMARQLRSSLVNYMVESSFNPSHQISATDLQRIHSNN